MTRIYIDDFVMPDTCSNCMLEQVHHDSYDNPVFAECPLECKGYTTAFREKRRADWCPLKSE